MAKAKRKPRLAKLTKDFAMIIAIFVRNEMEDFHCKHLTDEQMAELNPIIRNGICNALHSYRNYGNDDTCRALINFQSSLIPKYWEEPKLTETFYRMEEVIRDRKKDAK